MIFVYIKPELQLNVTEIYAESIGSGILGMMGNKGAVSIKIRYLDSVLTFLNCHLASDHGMWERRNQDYSYISKRLVFPLIGYQDSHDYYTQNPFISTFFDHAPSLRNESAETFIPFNDQTKQKYLSLFDTDVLIWMGDLNYRINMKEKETKTLIQQGKLDELLKFDQLALERTKLNCFNGFQEFPIMFNPTYKYDIGSDRYDTRLL